MSPTNVLCGGPQLGLERIQLLQERRLLSRVLVLRNLPQIATHTELYELTLHLLGTPPGIPLGIRLLFDLLGDEPEPTDGARDGEKQHVSQQTHRAPPPTATQCRRSCKAAMVPRTERSGARPGPPRDFAPGCQTPVPGSCPRETRRSGASCRRDSCSPVSRRPAVRARPGAPRPPRHSCARARPRPTRPAGCARSASPRAPGRRGGRAARGCRRSRPRFPQRESPPSRAPYARARAAP